MTPHERFAQWIAESGRSYRDMATEVGCSAAVLYRVAAGQRNPGRKIATLIEQLTASSSAGPILVGEWDGLPSTRAAAGSDHEANAIAAIARLDAGARERVLAYAHSRWGFP